jgi:hypothetical protein
MSMKQKVFSLAVAGGLTVAALTPMPAASGGGVSGPTLGFIFDSAGRTLRPIFGIRCGGAKR